MPLDNFITQMLNVKADDLLEITPLTDSANNVTVKVKLKDKRPVCPFCGESITIHGYKTRKLIHAALVGRKCTIYYSQRRYMCKSCQISFSETNPFSSADGNLTHETIINILKDLKKSSNTYSAVAERYNVSKSTVIRTFDKHVNIIRKPLTEIISIDEHYFPESDYDSLYCCLIMDFRTGTVLDVLPDRKKHYLRKYFTDIRLTTEDCITNRSELDNVRYVSIDMSENFRNIASYFFPRAVICADSFHVLKHLTESFRNVRLRCRRETQDKILIYLLSKFSYVFDHTTWVDNEPKYNKMLKRYVNLRTIRELLFSNFHDLEVAFNLKELYINFNKNSSHEQAVQYFDKISARFADAGIPEMDSFYTLLQNWRSEILNSFIKIDGIRINNSYIESRNAQVERLIYNSNGFTNFKRTRNRILYCLNPNDNFHL